MQVDIKTSNIKQLRNTFSHVARRLGADKPASRYQEATFDMQSDTNFHYRPIWDPQYELYDTARTAIKMADWYSFKDPRQYYYGVYTMNHAKQQDAAEKPCTTPWTAWAWRNTSAASVCYSMATLATRWKWVNNTGCTPPNGKNCAEAWKTCLSPKTGLKSFWPRIL